MWTCGLASLIGRFSLPFKSFLLHFRVLVPILLELDCHGDYTSSCESASDHFLSPYNWSQSSWSLTLDFLVTYVHCVVALLVCIHVDIYTWWQIAWWLLVGTHSLTLTFLFGGLGWEQCTCCSQSTVTHKIAIHVNQGVTHYACTCRAGASPLSVPSS